MTADAVLYRVGSTLVAFSKTAADAALSYGLRGELYLSKSGWLLLRVPNALARGAFAALHVLGAELPPGHEGGFDAHITVMSPEEIKQIGGPDKITERGKTFAYTLGPVRHVRPTGWPGVSRVYFIEVRSPELEKLRKSYGLSPLPRGGDGLFHISFAIVRSGVTRHNAIVKALRVHTLARKIDAARVRQHSAASEEKTAEETAPVPHARQQTDYTCGPAALKMVAGHEGVEVTEEEIAEKADSGKEKGTPPNDLAAAGKKLGLEVEMRPELTLDELKGLTDAGIPVICDIQDHGDEEGYKELTEGHYVVCTGVDDQYVYFNDPAIEGTGKRKLDRETFQRRWRDKEYNGRKWERLGLVVRKPQAASTE